MGGGRNIMNPSVRNAVLVIGAGAIGRGFLPWLFPANRVRWFFIDTNVALVQQLRAAKGFHAYRVCGDAHEKQWVPVEAAWTPQEWNGMDQACWLKQAAAVFINVGPRHALQAARLVERYDGPVILSENDPAAVQWVLEATGIRTAFFAVPDVIASNTASDSLLASDPLALIVENGEMLIDQGVARLAPELTGSLGGNIRYLASGELLNQHWTAKLYLHNTPHCVVAYLGALAGVRYVHEAMQQPTIERIVVGVMNEMLAALKLRWDIPHDFLDWYASKELARFRCPILFDPISRVAREPLRKLESEGRLLGAAQICLSLGVVPENGGFRV